MPTLDIIPENNFNQYLPANHHIGGFDWTLTFGWKELIEKRNASPPGRFSPFLSKRAESKEIPCGHWYPSV